MEVVWVCISGGAPQWPVKNLILGLISFERRRHNILDDKAKALKGKNQRKDLSGYDYIN